MTSNFKLIGSTMCLALVLGLSACSDSDDEDECLVLNRAARPDLTGSPVPAVVAVMNGNTIDINVPVDSDTAGGTVFLLPDESQDIAGESVGEMAFVVAPGVAQIATVTVTVMGGAAAGNYYPAVVLCNDMACTLGTAYLSDSTGFLTDGRYLRFNADGGSGNIDPDSVKDSCIDQPVFAVL